MGKAICTVEGFVAGTRAGTGKSGEYYFSISLACGKSTKDETTGQVRKQVPAVVEPHGLGATTRASSSA